MDRLLPGRVMIRRIIERITRQRVSRARRCQLSIERHVAPLLLTAALGVVGTFLAAAVQAQDLARATPDIRLAADDLATPDAGAGLPQPGGPAPTPEHTGFKSLFSDLVDDIKHLPSTENMWWAIAGGAGALAVHPADTHVTPYFVKASWAEDVFQFGEVLGLAPTLLGASAGVYFVGRATDNKKVSHAGMDLIQAVAVSQAIVQTLKFATQRERPDGSNNLSFPSGHSSDTFAVATALERHLGWKGAIPGYIFASYVAISRLHENRHYLSDVVFGSTTGIIAGRTVTRPNREFPVTVAPVPGGAVIMYARRGE